MSATPRPPDPVDVDCIDFVEMITDYLDEAVPRDARDRIDAHLAICTGCAIALAQWRAVIEVSGRLAPADVAAIDAATRARLFDAFRGGG